MVDFDGVDFLGFLFLRGVLIYIDSFGDGVRLSRRIVVDYDGVGFLLRRGVLIYIDGFGETVIFLGVLDGFVPNFCIHVWAVWVVGVCFE